MFTRDISRAYKQAETRVLRPVYVKPPSILYFPQRMLLHVDSVLYRLPEPGMYWFMNYRNQKKKKLNKVATLHSPCFLFIKPCSSKNFMSSFASRGITCLQTDDKLK